MRTAMRRMGAPGSVVLAGAALVSISLAGAPANASFPGTNGRIACSTPLGGPGGTAAVPAGQERLEIFSVNPDGSGEVRLTSTNSGIFTASGPKYSPDGRKIAFVQNNQIWTMNADGSDPRQITSTTVGAHTVGTWSPDGRQIVFHSTREPVPPGSPAGSNSNEIFKMDADGSNVTRLTNNLRFDATPSWSPDGSKIAFRSNVKGDHDVWTMNTDGTNTVNLTPDSPAEESAPEWSPDGRQIAFHSDRDAFGIGRVLNRNLEIYRMNANGTGVRRLTFTDFSGGGDPNLDLTGYDLLPAWSPQGDRIVFHSGRAAEFRDTGEIGPLMVPYVAQWDVYTINSVDGSDVRRVTNRPRNDENCDWQPLHPPATPRPAAPAPAPAAPAAGKLTTRLTLRARPRRDRRPPFRYLLTGRVRIPAGTSQARVCSGNVRVSLRRGRALARGTARVTSACTFRKRLTIRSARSTGRRRGGRLRVGARYDGNAFLRTSRARTTVRFF